MCNIHNCYITVQCTNMLVCVDISISVEDRQYVEVHLVQHLDNLGI